MKKRRDILAQCWLTLIAIPMTSGCATVSSPPVDSAPAETAAQAPRADKVIFTELGPNLWMHSSYQDVPGYGLIVSNGLIVADGAHSLLIDTAWNNAQTEQIIAFAENTLHRPISRAVSTHAHRDKMGGVGALRAAGVATYAERLSNDLAPQRGLVPAEHDLDLRQGERLSFGPVEIFNPGAAHTYDNIVVAVPASSVLFGGCMIRPGGSSNLGNTADGDIAHWAQATRAASAAFPRANVIIPSHGPPGGRELFDETVALADTATNTHAPEDGAAHAH